MDFRIGLLYFTCVSHIGVIINITEYIKQRDLNFEIFVANMPETGPLGGNKSIT